MFTLFNHTASTQAAYKRAVTADVFAAAVDQARVNKSLWMERADDNSGTYVWVRADNEPFGYAVGFVSTAAATPLAATSDNKQGWLYHSANVGLWLGAAA